MFRASRHLSSEATIGVSFHPYKTLDIWDTAGQEKYRALMGMYFKRIQAAFVIFDLTCRRSYDMIPYWVDQVRTHSPQAALLLIGTKRDLPRAISETEGYTQAHQVGAEQYWETSAWTLEGVREPFEYVVSTIRAAAAAPASSALSIDIAAAPPHHASQPACCWGGAAAAPK